MTASALQPPRFPHGRVYMTSRVIDLVRQGQLDALSYLERHLAGDWGDVSTLEKQVNNASLSGGNVLVSHYNVSPDVKLVVLTNLDHRLTKLMLLCEFLDDIDD